MSALMNYGLNPYTTTAYPTAYPNIIPQPTAYAPSYPGGGVINGSTGPFGPANGPGWFGANAGVNQLQFEQANRYGYINQSPVVNYHNPQFGSSLAQDAAGLASSTIRFYDANNNGNLEGYEVFNGILRNPNLMGNTQAANQITYNTMSLLDANGDGMINPVELTAYKMIQDSNNQGQVFDGAITPQERQLTSRLSSENPNLFKGWMRFNIDKLEGRYNPNGQGLAQAHSQWLAATQGNVNPMYNAYPSTTPAPMYPTSMYGAPSAYPGMTNPLGLIGSILGGLPRGLTVVNNFM